MLERLDNAVLENGLQKSTGNTSPHNRLKGLELDSRRAGEGSQQQQPLTSANLNNAEVNDIIVKIEMRKFQNLIANKIKHKNNLLQADMMRVYPLTKKE